MSFQALFLALIVTCAGQLQVKEQEVHVYCNSYCDANYSRPEYELEDFTATLQANVSSTSAVSSCYTSPYSGQIEKAECFIEIVEDNKCGDNITQLSDEVTEFLFNISTAIHAEVNAKKFSCKHILETNPSAQSGNYSIYGLDGEVQQIYCKMDANYCDGEGGWMRVAYINMTEPGGTCPNEMTELAYNNINHNLCGSSPSAIGNCISIFFPVNGFNYSKVCGQMRGYQYHSPDGFHGYLNGQGIDSNYVCGYSITHGSNPRKHIWTYAGGVHQDAVNIYDCPCNTGYSYNAPPPFVGNDYYCEAGLPLGQSFTGLLYASDVLWDGQNCLDLEGPCCTGHPNMPWFYKSLLETTNDAIEVRLCLLYGSWDEDVPIDLLELYVK